MNRDDFYISVLCIPLLLFIGGCAGCIVLLLLDLLYKAIWEDFVHS